MRDRNFRLLCLLLFVTFGLKLSAQVTDELKVYLSFTIQGKVWDSISSETLIGVNIFLKDTKYGTVSDANGNFTLEAPEGNYTLVFSYIGYNQKEVPLKLNIDLDLEISLSPAETEIEEVTVTAQRKFFGNMDYGREIPTINTEIIEKQNVNNASDILHARLAGVWATKTSGAPGDHQKIRIRGQNSLFTSAEPLYIVDGVPVPIVNLSSLGIADLNIHDIDNITVLKDASATSLYGFQGGNGVILIDTKHGGENKISFSSKFGVQWFNNYYDLMSTEEQLTSLDSAHSKMRIGLRNYYPVYSDTLCNRNWQKEIFSPGKVQEYQLDASGSKRLFKYYFSGNYTDHKGILPNSEYKRYTFSTRIGRSFWKRMAVDLTYRGSVQENKNNQDQYKGNQLLFEGISKSPCLECTPDSLFYDRHGNEINRIYYTYGQLNRKELPQSIIENNTHGLTTRTHAVNGLARLQITNHLSMDFMESFMYRHTDYSMKSGYLNVNLKSREEVILINHQLNLSYNNSFGKHTVSGVLAFRQYKDNLWWNVDTLDGSLPERYSLKNSMAAYGLKGSVLRNLTSYIGHISYNFNKRYFISAIANLSRVKEGIYISYYYLFPSVALSWDIAHEKPFRNLKWLNRFNLYTNWGRSGNYPLNGLANDLFEDVPYTANQNTGYYPAVLQYANHHLKHELTTEINYGLKSSFLNNRISFSAAYFDKQISGLIVQRDIPAYYGGGKMFLNIGEIKVKGFEMGFEWTTVQKQLFIWHNQFNLSTSSQTVSKLFGEEAMSFIDSDVLMPEFIINEGEPLGNIYGYKIQGRWTEADEMSESNLYVEHRGMKFQNADTSDNVLNQNDKVMIGNSIPKYTCNYASTIQYKNLSLDMIWYAAIGFEKYNATRAATFITGVNREMDGFINDSLKIIQSPYFYESSEFIEDASFIRLKTISLNYRVPKKIAGKIECMVSLSFENMLTITRYGGYDPEATIFTDNNFSDNSVDRGSYPNPKAVYVSINLKF